MYKLCIEPFCMCLSQMHNLKKLNDFTNLTSPIPVSSEQGLFDVYYTAGSNNLGHIVKYISKKILYQ